MSTFARRASIFWEARAYIVDEAIYSRLDDLGRNVVFEKGGHVVSERRRIRRAGG